MNKDSVLANEVLRKKLWINAWCSVAGAIGVTDAKVPTKWADSALKDFDERFNNSIPDKHTPPTIGLS